MSRTKTIIYWVATVWLALGMTSTGFVQLMRMDDDVAKMTHLGYPTYLLTILGVWKILGVVAVLIPKFSTLKEWAYAGFLRHERRDNFAFRPQRPRNGILRPNAVAGPDPSILVFQVGG